MRYVAIDLETTGLDPKNDQVLQVAMVVEDTQNLEVPLEELPTFTALIESPRYSGSSFALALNARLLEAITKTRDVIIPDTEEVDYRATMLDGQEVRVLPAYDWEILATAFVKRHFVGKAIAAGKNVAGFDMQFFGPKLRGCFMHRVLDVGSAYAALNGLRDESILSLETIKERLGLLAPVKHDALEDARDVVRTLRKMVAVL